MHKKISYFLLFISVIYIVVCTSCGYHLCTDMSDYEISMVNNGIKYIVIHSDDLYNSIVYAIKDRLRVHRVDIYDSVEINKLNIDGVCVPNLYILGISEDYITASVFQDGKVAEYQLVLRIRAKLTIPSVNYCYPINIQISRLFISNPEVVLFNDTQENDIRKDMYQDMVNKLCQRIVQQCKY